MFGDRTGGGRKLAGAALLFGVLLLNACDEQRVVEPPTEAVNAAPGAAVSGAAAAEGAERTIDGTNVYSDRLWEVDLALPGDDVVEIMSIPDVPAGQYIITGHIAVTNYDREYWTYTACYLRRDGRLLSSSVTHLLPSRGGGVNDTRSVPLAGHMHVASGGTRVSVECQRHGRLGSPSIRGDAGRTQVIAARVGGP